MTESGGMGACAGGVDRRDLLGGAAAGLLAVAAGCTPSEGPSGAGTPGASSASHAPGPAAGPSRAGAAPGASVSGSPSPDAARAARLWSLEGAQGARLGVYAVHTASGARVEHRADERFPLCSTYKTIAAAGVLRAAGPGGLDRVVRYTESDLMASSVVTRAHVATGLSLRDLMDAALRFSDGTAGNLLVRELGGPGRVTALCRELGDPVTRLDRPEPALADVTPGDPQDTSSPRALAETYRRLLLGDALPAAGQEFLTGLLRRNATGDARIRAGVPAGWTVADKTGGGNYGVANDVALAWPPGGGAPWVVAVLTMQPTRAAARDDALIAAATRVVLG